MAIHSPLMSRHNDRSRAMLPLLDNAPELKLAQARVHEACGKARYTLALWLAAQTQGPIVWIAPSWSANQLNCDGLQDWIDPARLVLVHPRRADDLLWTMEEALRAGANALSVVDLPALPNLTQVRRLHLAAETGTRDGPHPPTGLLLTPGTGGAPGVETRWHLSPAHTSGQQNWRLERLRARTASQKGWDVCKTGRTSAPVLKSA